MKTLSKSFTTTTRDRKEQTITISCLVSSREEAAEIGYDAFRADLYIDGKRIGDIAPVLEESGVLFLMIDGIDWVEMYMETEELAA